MAAEGTKDVSSDLQQRTGVKPEDKILIVNSDTQELQYVSPTEIGGGGAVPTPSDETFIII